MDDLLQMPGVLMPPGAGVVLVRAAAVIPVLLIVVFVAMLWLLGLACGEKRRAYVTAISRQAMKTIEVMLHGQPSGPVKRQQPRKELPGSDGIS